LKKSILATILLGLILVLAACGGGNSDSDTNTEVDNSTEETGTNSSEDSTANNDIEIKAINFEFDQAEYTVKAGEEVKISLVNEEGSHGIAIDDLDVKIDGDGDATFTPEEPGEYTIYCSIPCGQGHSDMVSTLIVE